MTGVVARLVLAMLLLPFTGMVLIVLAVAIIPSTGGPPVKELLLVWFLLYVFIGAYWILLWRDLVPWNLRRVALTAVASVLSLAGGFVVAVVFLTLKRQMPIQLSIMIGGGTVPITWVLFTVLFWRETPEERVRRLTGQGIPGVR